MVSSSWPAPTPGSPSNDDRLTFERSRPPRRVREETEAVHLTADASALVSGDAEALGRVIRSLLDNAFRHGKPPVGITVAKRDGGIQLEVRDAGPGLPRG